jgi:hypothetical protein
LRANAIENNFISFRFQTLSKILLNLIHVADGNSREGNILDVGGNGIETDDNLELRALQIT